MLDRFAITSSQDPSLIFVFICSCSNMFPIFCIFLNFLTLFVSGGKLGPRLVRGREGLRGVDALEGPEGLAHLRREA